MVKIEIFRLFGSIFVDNSEAEKSIAKTESKAVSLGKKVGEIGQSLSSTGKKMTTFITLPVVGLAGALAKTGIGYKAFKQESEQAFSVLLGSAEAAKKHMDGIMEFAKKTPFAFPDLVSANRKLVSFGVEASKTEPIMEAIANSVAAMGGGGAEIENMADIFAKITANGKITGEELNRLGDQGINALKILANQADVSMDDMRKAISNGTIDSTKAIDWLVDGMMNGTDGINGATVAMGGSLEALEGTWKGAVDKMKGAWRRAGDAIISDSMFDKLIESVNKLTDIINNLPTLLGPIVDQLGGMLIGLIDQISLLVDWFFNLDPSIQQAAVKFGALLVAAGPLLMILGKIISVGSGLIASFGKLSGAVGLLTNPIGWVIAALALLGTAFVALWNNSETFRDGVTSAFAQVREVAFTAFEFVSSFIQEKIAQIKEFWDENGAQFLEAVENVFNGIMAVVDFVMPYTLFLIQGTLEGIKTIFNGALTIIMGMIKVFAGLFTGDWSKLWSGIKDILSGILQTIWGILKTAFIGRLLDVILAFTQRGVQYVTEMGTKMVAKFNSLLAQGKAIFNSVKNAIVNPIRAGKDLAVGYAASLYSSAVAKFNSLKSSATSIFNGVKTAITKPVETARDSVKRAIDRIKGFFTGMKLRFPKITMPKLPRFSLEGKFNLAPPSVPKLKVNWNAFGGIFSEPTIFNTHAGLQGVGEAGPEAILPLTNNVLGAIGQAIAKTMDNHGQSNQQIIIKPAPVYLDGVHLVDIIFDLIDKRNYDRIQIKALFEGGEL